MTKEAGQAAGSVAGTMRSANWVLALAMMALMLGVYYAIQYPSIRIGLVNPFGAPSAWVDNGAWLYMIQHHLAQMVLALLVIAAVGRLRFGDWGLNLRQWRRSLRMTREFTLIFAGIIGVGLAIQLITGMEPRPGPPLTAWHVIGTLVFMGLISGLSEEILFRGMMQTWLSRRLPGTRRILGLDLPLAGVATAVIFAAVHVNFTLVPFAVTHLFWPQVALAFVLGLVYAVAYHRTGSLLAPILMHNAANALMAASTLTVAAVAA